MLLAIKINPMRPQLLLALLDNTCEFIKEIPDSPISYQQLSLNARTAVYHTFSIFLASYQHDISYSETRELTEAYVNVIKRIHSKFHTQQQGSFMSQPR